MKLVEGVACVESVDAFVDELGAIGDEHNCTVQAFDTDYVADDAHLESAVRHANRSIDREEAVANERAVEILLYAAGRRQISRALEMGVNTGSTEVVIVVDGVGGTDSNEGSAAEAVATVLSKEANRKAEIFDIAGASLSDTHGDCYGDFDTLVGYFDVSKKELSVVDGDIADIVRERVALLDVEK